MLRGRVGVLSRKEGGLEGKEEDSGEALARERRSRTSMVADLLERASKETLGGAGRNGRSMPKTVLCEFCVRIGDDRVLDSVIEIVYFCCT